MGDLWNALIVQPIFNLLVLIYGILPGHNFGLAIIIFTVIVRLLMWPLIKKQLHQVKVMRKLQPELKRIKKEAAGDKRKESLLMMELYKERGINPFGTIGVLILQIPILIGLYVGLQKVLKDPSQIETFAYPFLQHLPWIEHIAGNIKEFDVTLFGVIDLTRSALGPQGLYWPAMLIVIGSAVAQFYQSKQLSPDTKDARSLRSILREAKEGKQADQSEVNAAVGRSTRYLLPAMIFIFTVNIPSALALYWLTSGIVALIQQSIVLREDTEEMEASVETKGGKQVIEGEVVETKKTKTKPSKRKSAAKKRRKK
ncbi:MAG TPA: YidC/Oxa1 family membrane protein insertase [Candidatus Saccharimonadales bacterium]